MDQYDTHMRRCDVCWIMHVSQRLVGDSVRTAPQISRFLVDNQVVHYCADIECLHNNAACRVCFRIGKPSNVILVCNIAGSKFYYWWAIALVLALITYAILRIIEILNFDWLLSVINDFFLNSNYWTLIHFCLQCHEMLRMLAAVCRFHDHFWNVTAV